VRADFNAVVRLTYHRLDISQKQTAREVRDQFVNIKRPSTSSAIEVRRFVRPQILIEVGALAVVPL
jgi:hypothetical protein